MNEIVINYCKPCGYIKQATKAAELLKNELGIEAELMPGKGGIFNITVNGEIVAKRTRYGFPQDEEILKGVSGKINNQKNL
ncbi:Rdx family protein [Stygiobacter electus]|uniref:Rdx family protein n=1 Tax=Stygiobacter electus TaxID=3032292 RepID=A0AAE3P071_9BACT|nr:Rdx family protein [Stygiobacter electus]MDF1613281.1 Rdx family protein [Stygiobacter electus]